MTKFMSDNVTSACPEVMEGLIAANSGDAVSYGDDEWSIKLQKKLAELFETDVLVFPTTSGTASNALALSALTPPYGKIYCHALSHINTDECGAPEFFTGGAKLIPLTGDNGKFNANTLADAISGAGQVHSAQPACVTLTQACETGTVYSLDEISSIAETAHEHGMKVHMDGARFANALVNLDISPAEMTWKSGVDVLSFGGTKNGCLAAEAIIFFKKEMAETFPFLHKRAGQLLSKMRFVSAQLYAYVSNDVWLRNARHANQMATELSQALSQVPHIKLAFPTQSNEIFAYMSKDMINRLAEAGYIVSEVELDSTAPPRLVTAWNTDPADIDRLLNVLVGP